MVLVCLKMFNTFPLTSYNVLIIITKIMHLCKPHSLVPQQLRPFFIVCPSLPSSSSLKEMASATHHFSSILIGCRTDTAIAVNVGFHVIICDWETPSHQPPPILFLEQLLCIQCLWCWSAWEVSEPPEAVETLSPLASWL